jgi:hypothetical protein
MSQAGWRLRLENSGIRRPSNSKTHIARSAGDRPMKTSSSRVLFCSLWQACYVSERSVTVGVSSTPSSEEASSQEHEP